MTGRLNGKVAIVAGAGSSPGAGIGNGKASALTYAREDAAVVLVDLNREAVEASRAMIEAEGGSCIALQANVSLKSDCEAVARAAAEAYGRVDILHNNVGIEAKVAAAVHETDEDEWQRLMDINLKSMFLMCRAVLPSMIASGGGAIVNISSISAERFTRGGFLYCVTKAGVNALTRSLSIDYAEQGIRANAIMPGFMDTPMVDRISDPLAREAARARRNARVPMKRMGTAWDVAHAALFLVSDEARYISGQVMAVDGAFMNKIS